MRATASQAGVALGRLRCKAVEELVNKDESSFLHVVVTAKGSNVKRARLHRLDVLHRGALEELADKNKSSSCACEVTAWASGVKLAQPQHGRSLR